MAVQEGRDSGNKITIKNKIPLTLAESREFNFGIEGTSKDNRTLRKTDESVLEFFTILACFFCNENKKKALKKYITRSGLIDIREDEPTYHKSFEFCILQIVIKTIILMTIFYNRFKRIS